MDEFEGKGSPFWCALQHRVVSSSLVMIVCVFYDKLYQCD